MADESIDPDEYATWISPQAAMQDGYKAMLGHERVSDAISRRLNNGTLRSACKLAIWREGDRERREQFPLTQPLLWQQAMLTHESGIWHSGDIDIYVGGKAAYVDYAARSDDYVSLTAVRFDPEGLQDMFPIVVATAAVAPATPDSVQKERKPLAEAETRRFAQLYLDIWKDAATEGKALTAIRACYPENTIGRDPFFLVFRELRGPGKRGNPAFRG